MRLVRHPTILGPLAAAVVCIGAAGASGAAEPSVAPWRTVVRGFSAEHFHHPAITDDEFRRPME